MKFKAEYREVGYRETGKKIAVVIINIETISCRDAPLTIFTFITAEGDFRVEHDCWGSFTLLPENSSSEVKD